MGSFLFLSLKASELDESEALVRLGYLYQYDNGVKKGLTKKWNNKINEYINNHFYTS